MSDSPESKSGGAAKIFISYRRDDCAGHAGRLYDRLCDRFGADRIFMDIDSIEPGEDFVEVIDKTVGSCNILLALIGQEWLTSAIEGKRRLHNSDDFVRLEIATALRREIRVIPVLVQGASMPSIDELPDDLKRLVRRNALDVDDLHWHAGVSRLMSTIEKVIEKPAPPGSSAEPVKPVPASSKMGVSSREVPPPVSSVNPRVRNRTAKYFIAGAFGVVIVAALIYWQSGRKPADDHFAKATPLTADRGKEAAESSLDAIRRSITIRADRSPQPTDTLADGRTRHLYSIWIEAPPKTISRIAKVLYHYDHSGFETPRTESSNPTNGFRDSYNGIGAVDADMDVVVVLRDGAEIPFKFNMYEAVFGRGGTK